MISFAANRRIYGNWQSAIPSRFIEELPPENVEQAADQGLYGTGESSAFFDTQSHRHRRRSSFREQPGWQKPAAPATAFDPDEYQLGQRVFHQKFGYGMILSMDGDKLEISFEKAGKKKVMAGFVEIP